MALVVVAVAAGTRVAQFCAVVVVVLLLLAM
jgi:hypothetical protein